MSGKLGAFDCAIARIFAVLAAGIVVGLLTAPVAGLFDVQPAPYVPYLLGAVSAVACWFVSRRAFDFAEDAMQVPTPGFSPTFQRAGVNPRPAAGAPAKPAATPAATPAAKPAATPAAKPAATPAAKPVTPAAPAGTASREATSGPVSLTQSPEADGSLKVTVTTNQLSKREFNTLRARLEKVPGVDWSHPVNLHNGRRKMEGVIRKTAAQAETVGRLQELTRKS